MDLLEHATENLADLGPAPHGAVARLLLDLLGKGPSVIQYKEGGEERAGEKAEGGVGRRVTSEASCSFAASFAFCWATWVRRTPPLLRTVVSPPCPDPGAVRRTSVAAAPNAERAAILLVDIEDPSLKGPTLPSEPYMGGKPSNQTNNTPHPKYPPAVELDDDFRH